VFDSRDVRNGENIAGAPPLVELGSDDESGDETSDDLSRTEASGEGVADGGDSESVRESDRVAWVCIRCGSRNGVVAALDVGRENQSRTGTTSVIEYATVLARM
jgi:hypothetical protein